MFFFTLQSGPGRPGVLGDRRPATVPLLWLTTLTLAAIVVFGRWRGLTSLAGLVMSFAILLLRSEAWAFHAAGGQ